MNSYSNKNNYSIEYTSTKLKNSYSYGIAIPFQGPIL